MQLKFIILKVDNVSQKHWKDFAPEMASVMLS